MSGNASFAAHFCDFSATEVAPPGFQRSKYTLLNSRPASSSMVAFDFTLCLCASVVTDFESVIQESYDSPCLDQNSDDTLLGFWFTTSLTIESFIGRTQIDSSSPESSSLLPSFFLLFSASSMEAIFIFSRTLLAESAFLSASTSVILLSCQS